MKFVVAVGLVSLLLMSTALAQNWITRKPGTAVVGGRVIAADEAQPLSRAEVRLTGNGAGYHGELILLTDEQGRYKFTELPAGRFALSAGRSGYLTLNFGQRRSTDAIRNIEITEGQSFEDLDFSLPKAGAIDVTVTDEFGEPRQDVWVQVQQYRSVSGRPTLVNLPTSNLTQRNFVTDDRGQVRFYDLPPGDYYFLAAVRRFPSAQIEARPGSPASNLVYLPTFYPGTSSMNDAEPVALALGQEVSVRILIVGTPVARLSGQVVRQDGSPVQKGTLHLMAVTGNRQTAFRTSASLSAKGFEFSDVPPGDYLIERNPIHDKPRSGEHAALAITVSGTDMSDLVLTVRKAATLQGQIVLDTGLVPPAWKPDDLSLRLIIPNGHAEVDVEEAGTFTRVGLTGVAFGWVGAGPDWFLKAVMLDGRDITDIPIDFSDGLEIDGLEVLVTQKRTGVSGSVRDEQNASVSDYTAVIFAEDPGRWTPGSRFIATARAEEEGRFNIRGLPPGRYVAAALDHLESGQEYDPAFLGRLKQRAAPLTLGEGESKAFDLGLVTF